MFGKLSKAGQTEPVADPGCPGSSFLRELPVRSISSKPSLPRALAVATSRRLWGHRTRSWDESGSGGLTAVVEAVLAECPKMPDGIAVDLGCGSGQVTLPLARGFGHVLGVDISSETIALLGKRAADDGAASIQAVAHPLETLDLPVASLDLVVSNYALHHLRDRDKRRLLERAFVWLRPGGRLVIGDMMLGRGLDPADRAVILTKVRALARLGPGGWWRIIKNSVRFALRVQEKPLPPARWAALVREAGFVDLRTSRVVAEACVISATKPKRSNSTTTEAPDRQ
jgi:SAM-dependent methyltransferase